MGVARGFVGVGIVIFFSLGSLRAGEPGKPCSVQPSWKSPGASLFPWWSFCSGKFVIDKAGLAW